VGSHLSANSQCEPLLPSPGIQRNEQARQYRIRMALHVPYKRPIRDHNTPGSHGNGKGDVQSVVRRTARGQADVERDIVQIKLAGRCRGT
jgi:hypothetical protein